jgi:hypothetical protein
MPRAKPKLEYDSTNESKTEEIKQPDPEPVAAIAEIPVKKEKKPRTQKQIEATNKMREALAKRKEQAMRIKEETKLQREMMDKEIKKKISKLKEKEHIEKKVNKRISEKVKEELYKKLKEEVPSDDDGETDYESSESEIEPTPVYNTKPKRERKPTETITNTISFV